MRIVALALLLLTAPAGAATIVLDFEEEPTGERGSSFTSAEAPFVQLTELGGTDLQVFPRDPDGLVLWVGDEGGTLRLDFLVPVVSVTIEFGDGGAAVENFTDPVLTGFYGGASVDSATVAPTINGLIDQSLTVTGLLDAAVFSFWQLGEHEPESPLVGRIILETAPVPEPGAAMLLGAAGLGLARVRSRSRAAGRYHSRTS